MNYKAFNYFGPTDTSSIQNHSACSASGTAAKPGSTIFHVARAARTLLTWCWISSCNLGTLASFARLPISDVVVRSRTKFGAIVNVRTGATEVGEGGRTLI